MIVQINVMFVRKYDKMKPKTVYGKNGVFKMEDQFKIISNYKSEGDQPKTIDKHENQVESVYNHNTLLGATGKGKTFTISNVVEEINRPTLVIAHNKTLAGQLYSEFKEYFPDNAVEYFVSYYDYYQPEA